MSRLQPASSLMLTMTKILHGTTSMQGLIRRLVREGGSQRRAVRCRRRTDCECVTAMVKWHQSLCEAEFGCKDTPTVLLMQLLIEGLGSVGRGDR
jgi:hypothetical protein